MKRQTILWTALPNGIGADGKRRLSVLVSPRLETDELLPGKSTAILDQFPDFLDWPGKAIEFRVKVRIGAAIRTLPAVRVSPAPDSALWSGLFKSSTFVRSHQFDKLDDRVVRSYPATQVLAFLKQQYQAIAVTAPTRYPSVQQLAQEASFGQIAFDFRVFGETPNLRVQRDDRERSLEAEIDRILKREKAVPPREHPNPPLDFIQLKRFHKPMSAELPPDPTKHPQTVEHQRVPKIIDPPKIDFHQMLSTLGEYPELMVRLGLVIHLELKVPDGIPIASASEGWVEPKWSPGSPGSPPVPTSNVTPRTRIAKEFRAKPGPAGADLSDGMLKLNSLDLYDVVQVDVDGAALKAMNFASNLLRSLSDLRTADTPERSSMPSLQSAGLSLVRIGRAPRLVKALETATNNNGLVAANKVTLFAEDLVRGYRVDVWDERSGEWHSLCERVGRYDFLDAGITLEEVEDEGSVSLAVTESADKSSPDLHLPESVCRWAGWSLCAPRPGTRLNPDNQPEPYTPSPATEFKLVTSFTAKKGSLPRLRFGNQYRLRARAVDLAGNSPSLEEAGDKQATEVRPYLRFEPVSAPAIVLRESLEMSPGESPERLVIRSFNDAPDKDGLPPTKVAERHIAPALGAPSLAEAHRKFDGAAGLKKTAYATITRREGTFDDTTLIDLDTGVPIDIEGPGGVEIVKKTEGGKVVYQYPVHHEAQLVLPYLPDPLARGAALLGLPNLDVDDQPFLGLPGAPLNQETEWHGDGSAEVTDLNGVEKPPITLIKIDFGPDADWPVWKPFRLRVEGVVEPKPSEVLKEPAWQAGSRQLTVVLPQAEIARVRLSSYLREDDLKLMGLWKWIEETGVPAALRKRLAYYGLQGRHWMLTPHRDLVLVHATQQPLRAPKFVVFSAGRKRGATFALLSDRLDVHVKSTGKIDIRAEWSEPVDDLADTTPLHAEPKNVLGKAQAFDVSVPYPRRPIQDPEHFDNKIVSVSGRHEFGDTKYRRVTYRAVATTRFREYFETKGTDPVEKWTRVSEPVTLDILSTARPPAPRVLYVLPTFGWEKKKTGTGVESRRSGGGLRVYMERPWFSSGEGERLGAVLYAPRRIPGLRRVTIPDTVKPYVTRWGADPIWLSDVKTSAPSLGDFEAEDASETGLTLEEVAAARVAVAGHSVGWDEERQLWYCDIQIDAHGAYYPFIRLALARYQPRSVVDQDGDVKLSRVVLADFAQLAPDRSASVSFDPARPTRLTVAVSGVRGRGATTNEIEVAVERREPAVGGELGWIPVPDAEVEPRFERGLLWFGTVTLPERSVDKSLRLAIREYEVFVADPGRPRLERRLVYADAIEI